MVRLMATVGFLTQLTPSCVTHTPLSNALVTDMGLLDAAMFLAESAAPAALHMVAATHQTHEFFCAGKSAYSISQGTTRSFEVSCLTQERLRRQWSAFNRCTADPCDDLLEALGRLSWSTLEDATIVDVSI
jgi:poly(3-hydroxybutyrate) depolymerase